MDRISIVYSSDNHYAQHAGVSMLSLFENNKEFDEIDIYLIDTDISSENKYRLMSICQQYNRTIRFIDFKLFSDRLVLNIGNSISINSYARLFLSNLLPDLDKVIYMDSDSIINGSLSELWQTDIQDYYAAGVYDTVSDDTKQRVGMKADSPYMNAGMLLINLTKWREEDVEKQLLAFIDSYGGRVFHHDQGTINGVLHRRMLLLHPKYNAMTTFFTMTRDEMQQYYGRTMYYSDLELKQAIRKPIFVHFTPAFVNRPWIKGSKHPMAPLYLKYLEMSPWIGTDFWEDQRGRAEKMIAFLYMNLPFAMANSICKRISK